MIKHQGFRVQVYGLRVQGSEFRFQQGLRVKPLRVRVKGERVRLTTSGRRKRHFFGSYSFGH